MWEAPPSTLVTEMSSYDEMRLPNGDGDVCEADSPPRKRHRASTNCVAGSHDNVAVVDPEDRRRRALEHKTLRAKNVRDRAADLLCELYFLQAGGNMMDYAVWRKRPHAPALRAFLDTRRPPPIEPAPSITTSTPAPVDDIGSVGGGAAERARQEASVTRRAAALAAAGLWGAGRLPRVLEPPRPKAHHDYLLEEMAWLAADFAGERRWKQAAARRVARQCARAAVARAAAEERAARAVEAARRRTAAVLAREVRLFWVAAEKLSRWTRARRHAAKRKALLDRQLVDMVGRTERYSRQLAATLRGSPRTDHERPEEPETPDTAPPTDEEFSPSSASSDDEETIAAADAEAGDTLDELEALQKESALELSDVLATLPPGYLREAKEEKPREESLERQLLGQLTEAPPAPSHSALLQTPGLLRHTLREYQREGLQWLATMHARKLNGVLADEMGLGKTIQTIALLALLAERGDWGPHLVVAPTSVVVNWEMELKKWCPALKVLTYLGSIKERKHKRRGWTKPNSFHVCITSYKLVVQDHQSFRRKRWNYLILDEAQNIKNFKSQRWQLLLNFQTERRLLLTGTPLQNSLLELWSLMHFLMPGVFASHSEFREWFAPVADDAGSEPLARRLHALLRPFLLRRLKRDVERQLPSKRERVVMCRLSKRQRCLYDDFLSRAKTRDALAGGRLPAVVDVLMQLRKVCNHPDLLEPRAAQAPLRFAALALRLPAVVLLEPPHVPGPRLTELEQLGAVPAARSRHLLAAPRDAHHATRPPPPAARLRLHLRLAPRPLPPAHPELPPLPPAPPPTPPLAATPPGESAAPPERDADEWCSRSSAVSNARRAARLKSMALVNERRASVLPLLGGDLRAAVRVRAPSAPAPLPSRVANEVRSAADRLAAAVGGAMASGPVLLVGAGAGAWRARLERAERDLKEAAAPLLRVAPGPRVLVPHPRLLQYDCGKLQTLAPLLRRLRAAGHRALLFSQMTRTLDVLEAFLCMHGLTYLRLDGATKAERRQALVDRFNRDPRVFAMLLSTRSGGVGLNLTGADTVLFYDSDWNPTMDAQAMDRAHRIGQTRDVHVYRLVSAGTVEENILRKAEQKRALGHRAIEAGRFTAAGIRELLGGTDDGRPDEPDEREELETALAAAEDEADAAAAKRAQIENDADIAEFDETSDIPPKDPDEDPELHRLMDQLSGVEKYAMRVLAQSESAAEEEAQAAEELRLQHEQWSSRSVPNVDSLYAPPDGPRSSSPAPLTYAASPQVLPARRAPPPSPPPSPPAWPRRTARSRRRNINKS